MSAPTRSQLVISALFYPAFLGNMSYAALEKLFRTPGFFDPVTGLLVAALIVHYVMDWAYTVAVKERESYPALKLLSDALIVVCLYIALRLVLKEDDSLLRDSWAWLREPAFWLLLTKAGAVAWELTEAETLNPMTWPRLKKLELAMDSGFALVYLVLLLELLGPLSKTLLFALAVLGDAACYLIHERYRVKWGAAAAARRS